MGFNSGFKGLKIFSLWSYSSNRA